MAKCDLNESMKKAVPHSWRVFCRKFHNLRFRILSILQEITLRLDGKWRQGACVKGTRRQMGWWRVPSKNPDSTMSNRPEELLPKPASPQVCWSGLLFDVRRRAAPPVMQKCHICPIRSDFWAVGKKNEWLWLSARSTTKPDITIPPGADEVGWLVGHRNWFFSREAKWKWVNFKLSCSIMWVSFPA